MYTLGIDVSQWQGEMDWAKAARAQVKFAFIRAGFTTQPGVLTQDSQFERNASLAPAFIPVGYYYFLRPNFNPTDQADFFTNLIAGKTWPLRPVVDVEADGGLSSEAVADSLEAFINRVQSSLSVLPLIYTRASFWNDSVADRALWSSLELWVARYSSARHPWGECTFKPRDWSDWLFWQYTDQGTGSQYGAKSVHIDLDHFNGSEKDLYAYANAPLPSVVKVSYTRAATVYTGMNGKTAGATWQDRQWAVTGKSVDSTGNTWYKVEGWLRGSQVEAIP